MEEESQKEDQKKAEEVSQEEKINLPQKNIIFGVGAFIVLVVVAYVLFKGAFKPKTSSLSEATASATPAPTPRILTVPLNELGNSGEKGAAILEEVEGKVKVRLALEKAPKGVTQPAHIHKGSCPAVGDVLYPLTFPKDGASETTLDVTLDLLLAQQPLAINVHKSASQSKVYVSCGDIKN